MSGISPVAAAGFAVAADAYERGRPGYPEAAVEWLRDRLRLCPGRVVLDLAAGTGKLTRSLVPLGASVVAVEPVDAMRAKLEVALPDVEALAGTAEAIPLADESVDAVLVAQAFHWFDAQPALREIRRVLRPGGGFGAIWNSRDSDAEVNRAYDALIEPYTGDDVRRHYTLDLPQELRDSRRFGAVEERAFPHEQRLDLETFVERMASTSFIATLPDGERARLLDRARELGRRVGEPIAVPYVTQVFAADALDPPFE